MKGCALQDRPSSTGPPDRPPEGRRGAGPRADRLDVHNADYGFARNFAKLRPLWLAFLVFSLIGCWVGYAKFHAPLVWGPVSSILLPVGIAFSSVQERHVRVRARHYTDSFFSAVIELDEAEHISEDPASKQRKASAKKAKGIDPEKATGCPDADLSVNSTFSPD